MKKHAWNSICKDLDANEIQLSMPLPISDVTFNFTPDQAREIGRHLLEWSARLRGMTLHEELDVVKEMTTSLELNMQINRKLQGGGR